jgi:hypothetical protein
MIALALLAVLAQDLQYETIVPKIGDRVDKVLAWDLNGDGLPDLVVQSGRDLQVFLYDREKRFTVEPQQVLRLDPTVFLWCFGKLDGEKFPALLTSGSRAIQAYRFDGKTFGPARDLVVHPSIFEGSTAEAHPPVYFDFAPDIDQSGRSDLLLFQQNEIFIMHPEAGGAFHCRQKLPVPVERTMVIPWTAHMKLSETAAVPLLAFGDMTGEGRMDLSYYHDEGIGLFELGANGIYAPLKTHDLTVDPRKRRPNRFIQFDFPPRVTDLNGDGLLDVAVIYPSKGRVQVYFGGKGKTDWTQPDQTMQVADGWSTGIYIEPLSGGKGQDLIMGVIRKFGLTGGIQAFLSGKVSLELHIYAMEKSGRYSRDPVQELKFEIPYTFHVTRESTNLDLVFRPNFKGDFNKDGRRDMLLTADEHTLRIYPGVPGKLISEEPSGSIHMDPPPGTSLTESYIADFNGDGRSDLVLRHVVSPDKQTLEIKISK